MDFKLSHEVNYTITDQECKKKNKCSVLRKVTALIPHEYDKSLSGFTRYVVYLVALFRVILLIAMWCADVIHYDHYTYWNYTFGTTFYVLLAFAYLTEFRYLFNILSQFVLPALFGSVMLVFLFISIIMVFNGGWLFIEGSVLGYGSTSIGVLYAGDKVIHAFPLLDLLIVFVAGYLEEVRRSVLLFRIRKSVYTSTGNILHFDRAYTLYCFVAPLPLFFIYASFFNPFEEYPTVAPRWILLTIAFLSWILVMYLYVQSICRRRKNSLALLEKEHYIEPEYMSISKEHTVEYAIEGY